MRTLSDRRGVRKDRLQGAVRPVIEALEQRTLLAAGLGVPSVPVLYSACDTGVSAADGITSYNNSTGQTLKFDVTGANMSADVQILLAGTNTILGSATADSTGFARVSLRASAGIYADGSYSFVARQELGGKTSPVSASTLVVVDTTAPQAPGMALDSASDAGASDSDNLTNVTTPIFDLSNLSASYRIYLDGTLAASGASVSNWTSPLLADGNHEFRIETEDLAGNISAQSSTTLTIDTAAPASSTLDLQAQSDSGLSDADDLTNDSTPTFDVISAGAPYYRIYREASLVSGLYESGADWTSQTLTDGPGIFDVIAVDEAGNTAAATSLSVMIDTVGWTTREDPRDPSFGVSGSAVTGIQDEVFLSTAMQADGMLVAAGYRYDVTAMRSVAMVLRFRADGTPDPTFATAGRGLYNILDAAKLQRVFVLPNGKILAVGQAEYVTNGYHQPRGCLIRLNADGSLDTTFGDNGTVVASLGSANCSYLDAHVAADGTITVVGYAKGGSSMDMVIARYLPTGSIDGSFGVVYADMDPGTSSFDEGHAISIDDAGTITVAGITLMPDGSRAVALARYDRNGRPDLSLNGTGRRITSLGMDAILSDMGVQSDGHIVVVGAVAGSEGFVARLNPDGTVDTTFGNAGVLKVSVQSPYVYAQTLHRVLVAPDDSIWFAGSAATTESFSSYGLIGHYGADGQSDSGFGIGGVWKDQGISGRDIVLLDDQHVLIAGSYCNSASLTRLLIGAGAPSLNASSDTGLSSSDRITSDTTPMLNLPTPSGYYARVFRDGVLVSDPYLSGSSYVSGPLADGTYTFSLSILDAAGNATGPDAGIPVTIDTVAPAAPALLDLDAASDSGSNSSDNITKDSTPSFTLSAGEYFRFYAGATLLSGSYASGSGFTAGVQSDGIWTYGVTAVDRAGNESGKTTLDVMIDTVAPAAPVAPDLDASSDSGLSNTDNITKLANLLLNISASPYYRLYENGVQISADYATSPTFSRTLTTEGIRSYTIRAVDAAGNLSPESAALQVTYDRTAPTSQSPLLAAGSDTGIYSTDWVTRINTPTITTAGNSAYQLYVDSILVGTYAAGQMATLSPLSDGTHTITMYAMDVAGNLATGMSHSITIDTVAPANATLSLRSTDDSGISNTDGVTNMTTPTFLLSSTNYFILQRNGVDLFSPYTWSNSYRVSYQSDGTYVFTARLSDVAGNTVTTNAVTVTIDTVVPAAPPAPDLDSASDTGSSSTDNITNDNTPTFTLPSGGGSYRLLRNGSIVSSWTTGTGVTLPTQTDGTYTYTLQTMDLAGNISSASPGLSVTIDTFAPGVSAPTLTAASDSGVSSSDRITNVQNPVFDISALMGLGDVTLLLDGSPIATVDWSNPSLQINGVSDGSHTLTARRTDVAGNPGSGNVSFTIDTIAPAAPTAPDLQAASDDGVSNTDNITSIQSPVFSVAAGQYFLFVHDGVQVGGNYLTGSSYALSKIGAGQHTAVVYSRDVAGNVSMPSPGLTYTIVAAPAYLAGMCDSGISRTDGITNYNNAPGKELQFQVPGTAPGDTVRLYIDNVLAGTATAGDIQWYVNLDPGVLADGTHSFVASRTPAGGAGGEVVLGTPREFVIDTVAPVASGMPDLLPAYDSGISDSDNITNYPAPKIHVDVTEGIVSLKALGGNTFAIVNGEVTLPYLYPGANLVGTYAQDIAGNEAYGPVLTITYDYAAPMKPSAPTLNPASDIQPAIGLSPAAPVATGWSVAWAPSAYSLTDWSRQLVEWDINTGQQLRYAALNAPDWWSGNIGVAAGNGELYVAFGSGPWLPGGNHLYVYDPATLELVREVTCGVSDSYGFGFVNGKLYSSNGSTLREIDPQTGAAGPAVPITLNGQPVYLQRGLTGAPDRGTLLGTIGNRIVYEINPTTGVVLRSITLTGIVGTTPQLTYRAGEIVALGVAPDNAPAGPSYAVRFDVTTGARLGYSQCSAPTGDDLGGDAFAPVRPVEYYRVYRDGVRISGDYVSAADFTDQFPLDGAHVYTVTAVDAAGNESVISDGLLYDPMSPPGTPYLDPNVDSGTSNADGVTMFNNSPDVPLRFQVPGTFAGDTVRLYVDGVFAGSAIATGGVTNVMLNPGIVADGTHIVHATRSRWAGSESPQSAPGTFTVDTVAPEAPAMPDLLPVYDSGVSDSDNVTFYSDPKISIVSDAYWLLEIDGNPSGDGAATPGQNLILRLPLQADGQHTIAFCTTDLAGNLSPMSAPLVITIDTIAPEAILVAPDLLSQYDSGISDSDNITNSTTLGFAVASPSGQYYRVYINYNLLNSEYESNPQFVLDWFGDEDARVFVESVDAAGNVSSPSPSLDVTIDRDGPAAPAPVLDPAGGNLPTLLLPASGPYAPIYTWDWSSGPLVIAERDSTTGAVLRNYELPGQVWSLGSWSMAQDADFIYVFGMGGSNPAAFLQIDRITGAFAGQRDVTGLPEGYTMQGLAMLNGRLYTAASSGDLLCEIDPASGAVLRTIALSFEGQPAAINSANELSGAADRGTLIATAYDGTLAEIDPATGQITAFHSVVIPATWGVWNAYAGNGVVFLGIYPGSGANGWDRAAVNIDTGEVLWRTPDDTVYWPAGYAGDGILVSRPRVYYRVYRDGVQVSDDYVSGTSFTDESPLTGTHIYTVFAVDAAGNVSPASDPFVVNLEAAVTIPDATLQAAIRQALNEPTGDITATDMASLTSLSVWWSGVSSLSGLEYAVNLQQLYLSGNQVSDLTPLAGLSQLTDLDLSFNQVSDLTSLAGLSRLAHLDLNFNQVSDVTPLAGLEQLISLNLGWTQVADVTPLANLTNLTWLGLQADPVRDVSSLWVLPQLLGLDLSNAGFADLGSLYGMTQLQCLFLEGNQITDVGGLANLTNLTTLFLSNNQISDISALAGMTKMFSLILHNNQISDLSPLSGMTELYQLTAHDNRISDVSPLLVLSHLNSLELQNNQITSIAPLSPLIGLRWLDVSYNDLDISAGSEAMSIILAVQGRGGDVVYSPQNP